MGNQKLNVVINMEDTITISKKQISSLVNNAGRMMFKKEAEDELLKLIKVKDDIDNALSQVKEAILTAGRSITPDFTGVLGKRVKCVVRKYGDRYKSTNPEYIKEIIMKRTDADKIDEYVDKSGKLPEGVSENEREEKLTIIVPNNEKTTIGQIGA